MKLVGDLKKKAAQSKSEDELKNVIKDAGMELSDEELKNVELSDEDADKVAGGVSALPARHVFL